MRAVEIMLESGTFPLLPGSTNRLPFILANQCHPRDLMSLRLSSAVYQLSKTTYRGSNPLYFAAASMSLMCSFLSLPPNGPSIPIGLS